MIKLFITDVDGTLTDGKINISSKGELFKSFDVKDGMGFKRLIDCGVIPIIITGRKSDITVYRAKELSIQHVYQDVSDKKMLIKKIANEMGILANEIAFIGDDINDFEAMQFCKLSACPNDAVKEIKEIATFVSSKNGGCGAVREFVDYILSL